MLTPQELNDHVFTKAVFGGYDIPSTDEFLDSVTEDYAALCKENAVLKSKLRILVEKLEEYRHQEAPMQSAIISAQKKAERLVQEAKEKAETIVKQAQEQAAQATRAAEQAEKSARHTVAASSCEVDTERERLNRVKAETASFIQTMEQALQHHQDLLEQLKMMDLTPVATQSEQAAAPAEEPQPAQAPQSAPEPEASDASEEITEEIEQQLEKLVGGASEEEKAQMSDTKVIRGLHPESITAKFGELKFGKNYNPNK